MDDRTQKIITMSDGRQIYVEESPVLKVTISSDDNTVEKVQEIDISSKQRDQLLKKISTNEICYDENSKNVTFTPRETD